MSKRLVDLTGRKFGKLTVISLQGRPNNRTMWNCLCDCGCRTIVEGSNMKSGHSLSCGCGKDGSSKITHGHKSRSFTSPTYSTWRNMHNRCENPNMDNYKYYGDRGIIVCKEWYSFEQFLADMGERPYGMCIERKDNDKGYYKDNCKWATMLEQAKNRR